MFENHARSVGAPRITTIAISTDERAREAQLRAHFAEFWGSAQGAPRAIYDTFISATPLASDVVLEPINEARVQGWWVEPKGAPSNHALLYIHGGGYVMGSARAYRGFASQIARRAGAPALVIDYPLAPETTLPLATRAVLAAWDWLRARGIDEIALVGDSAGGGLTLATLAALRDRPGGGRPVAAVVFSPWADLAFTGRSMTDAAVVDPLISEDYLRRCAQQYLGGQDPRDPRASPLFGDLAQLPPLLIQVGTDERLLDDSRQYATRAASAGSPVELEVWEGMHHVFPLDVAHLESSRSALDRAARFLKGHFAHR
jgi:epsilon-lactone hydrolase